MFHVKHFSDIFDWLPAFVVIGIVVIMTQASISGVIGNQHSNTDTVSDRMVIVSYGFFRLAKEDMVAPLILDALMPIETLTLVSCSMLASTRSR